MPKTPPEPAWHEKLAEETEKIAEEARLASESFLAELGKMYREQNKGKKRSRSKGKVSPKDQ